MSGIQSLLAIGAIWLFALVSINFNTTVVHNISIEVENKSYLDAFSIADDMIEEIKQKTFDEIVVDSFYTIYPSDLSNIGKDSGENLRKSFDDIDDYNGLIDTVGLPYVENFKRTVAVSYANPDNFDDISFGQNSSNRSFYKRVDVRVESLKNYLSNPVNLSFIFSLHSK
jgi:hypothetical protein